MVPRQDVVIATKVHGRMRPGPNGGGLSRKAILAEIDDSLTRLGTDYVDLYQIHRWDRDTPIEETLEAPHDVVKAGKARYIGASSMYSWQFAKALYTADLNGWTRFVSMQNHYNLLYREEEREMLPLCGDQGVGVIPWSPLARGRLPRPWEEQTNRVESDEFGRSLYREDDRPIVDAVLSVANNRGIAPQGWRCPGCSVVPVSMLPSSVPPGHTTSPMPSPPSTCTLTTPRSSAWRRATSLAPWPGSAEANRLYHRPRKPRVERRTEQPRRQGRKTGDDARRRRRRSGRAS